MRHQDRAVAALLATAVPFALPLAVPFRGLRLREGVVFQGPSGWGEFAPFAEYDDSTCARWLAAGVESAYGQWPPARRDSIPVNAIVPAVSAREAAQLTYRAVVGDGCQAIKVKVAEAGQSLEDDLARVSAVRTALDAADARGAVIRVDANGAWTPQQALVALRELDDAARGLEYAEQPCATLAELALLRRTSPVPVAADESIRTAGDPIAAVAANAADLIVLKVPPLGGVGRAARIAEAAGVPVVVSGALDSAVGLSAGLALAAALPQLRYACGLGTGALLAADLTVLAPRPRGGQLPVTRFEPDPAQLAAAAQRLDPRRRQWWRDRLARAWAAGAAELTGSLVPGSGA